MGTRGRTLDRELRWETILVVVPLLASVFVGTVLLPVASANQGPADSCGYQWTDSHDPPPKVNFTWEEIQSTGTRIGDWSNPDDGFSGPFDLGFNFTFYDANFTQVFVDTNGYLSFDRGYPDIPYGLSIPNENTPNNFAMAFGADLIPGYAAAPDGVYYQHLASPNRFVVEFAHVSHYGGTNDPVTFETVLYESGEIWFQYDTVAGALYAVGIENRDGTVGSPYDPSLVSSGSAVRFQSTVGAPGPVGVGLTPCSQSGRAIPGTSRDFGLAVSNRGTSGNDTFDLTSTAPSGWNTSFYQADGLTPLNDTNGNGAPDTGPLASSAPLDVILRVDVPTNASGNGTGVQTISVIGTSTLDPTVSASARVLVAVVPAYFAPSHSDHGLDTDGDGQFNYLVVAVNVTVSVATGYRIDGFLSAPSSTNLSLYASNTTYLGTGVSEVWLFFSGAQINNSGADGPYQVSLNLFDAYTGTLWDSTTISTGPYNHLEFESPPAHFTPPHFDFGSDGDQDGQFNYLVADINITVDVPSYYYVDAYLHDPNYTLAIDAYSYNYLNTGFYTLEFNYDGTRINGSGVDGPYQISLVLYDLYYGIFVDSDVHITAAYSHLDFEPPAGLLSPPHTEAGLDVDGDSLFNFLNVNVSLQVNTAGTFQINGYLHAANGTLNLYDSASLYLDVGLQTITLSFDGVPINQSGIDGPYSVDLDLYYGYGPPLDHDLHMTAAYSHLDFDGDPLPLGQFVPPHSDSGIDTDADGLYNYLAVDVRVAVGGFSAFYVVGTLHDPSNTLYVSAAQYAYFDPGLYTIQLLFDGVPINRSDIDGPYTVDLTLYNAWTGQQLDTDTHATAAYSHWAFNGPPGRFYAPHADAGVDSDGDGRFNQLVVSAHVSTQYAGVFLTYAVLSLGGGPNGSSSNLIAVNVTYLGGGPATINFAFNGYRINASGIDGPYRVDMWMYDGATYQFLDNDTHWTAAYAHTDFEEIPHIDSPFAVTPPTIDGIFSPGEWANAHVEALSAVPGNSIPAYLFVADDNQFLYVAYDVVGDTTPDSYDAASIGFDTGNDGIGTNGTDDEIAVGGFWSGLTAHFVFLNWNGTWGYWVLQDSPINESMPNHAGLAAARGFSRSDFNNSFHRVYEFRIPFALLGVKPGDTVGLFGGSHEAPGIFDASTGRQDQWPDNSGGPLPLPAYGDLTLGPDVTKPEIAIGSPAPGTLFPTDSATVSWSASDVGLGLDHFILSVDGTVVANLPATSRSYNFASLADGTRTLGVTAVDAAGNERSASVDVLVDTTPPIVEMLSPAPGTYLTVGEITATWTATDATSGVDHFEVTLDGTFRVNLPATTSTFTYTGLADGAHTIAVTAFDVAGHWKTASALVTIDTTAPSVTPLSPAAHSLLNTPSATVTWTAGDSGSGLDRIEIAVDGNSAIALPGTAVSYTFAGLSDGSHTVSITAVDRAGNSHSAAVSFTVDATPPTLAITSPSDQAILSTSAISVSWTSADGTAGLARLEVNLDGGAPVVLGPGSSSYAFLGIADGTHTVGVRSVDRAGNARIATVVIVVDTVSPSLAITSPAADGLVSTGSVHVAWTSQDVTSGIDHFTVSLDGSAAAEVPGSAREYTFASVPDGVRSIRVTAIDRAGHSGTAFVTFVVDHTPPILTLISPTNGVALTSPSVELRFTAVDATGGVARIEIVVDGAAPVVLGGDASSYTIAGLTDGTHTITIRAVDRAGNIQQSSITVHIDTAVLSPSGPYGVAPLGGVSIVVIVAVLIAMLGIRRRKRAPPPPPHQGNE